MEYIDGLLANLDHTFDTAIKSFLQLISDFYMLEPFITIWL